jgi:hypothetical protein
MGSDSNRPVMVYEGAIRPSHRNREHKPDRIADFIELPMPHDELDRLAETPVKLAVTLSYFIDPTDNLTRGTYAGGRLRWDLQGPAEDSNGFRARVNRLVREQGHQPGGGSYGWDIGTMSRSRGTLQHDRAQVAASQIAGPRLLAVYPVTGWWEDSTATWERRLCYSLIVSVDLGEVDLDRPRPVLSGRNCAAAYLCRRRNRILTTPFIRFGCTTQVRDHPLEIRCD